MTVPCVSKLCTRAHTLVQGTLASNMGGSIGHFPHPPPEIDAQHANGRLGFPSESGAVRRRTLTGATEVVAQTRGRPGRPGHQNWTRYGPQVTDGVSGVCSMILVALVNSPINDFGSTSERLSNIFRASAARAVPVST